MKLRFVLKCSGESLKGFRQWGSSDSFMLQSVHSACSVERVGGIQKWRPFGDSCAEPVPGVIVSL